MRCFSHSDHDARGVCKSCQRALCSSCMTQVGKSVACLGRCEEDVRNLDEMVAYNLGMIRSVDMQKLTADSKAALQWSRSVISGVDWFLVVLGAVFLAYAAYGRSVFLAALGLAFFGFGLFGLVRGRRAPGANEAA